MGRVSAGTKRLKSARSWCLATASRIRRAQTLSGLSSLRAQGKQEKTQIFAPCPDRSGSLFALTNSLHIPENEGTAQWLRNTPM